ncbi:glycosyltransferase family 2 protein [Flavobacterium hungaricum]|uniref:Glycosyltransferase n=1 Tax=Flavobacterium hungaricum TaxID=2082725 RepID=A0ABR9TE67_9FLAO|nr:glycosyltransferase family 2 protein [Flavobacterium hungaricum]MBE8723644.1 glycosyltransferase [Flavobacterium hungaricum]
MLSILIPVYNYNVFSLVSELAAACNYNGISYEILCQDDASNSTQNILNQEINSFSNCFFYINEINLGRGKNINSLAKKSKYDWLLIIDCDTFPAHENFISNYIKKINENLVNVCFGGILYQDQKPKKEQLLRWIYGQKRETISILTSNLLIKKEIFLNFPFDESITKYGYEDLVFFSVLKQNKIEISKIENPAFHLNLETSTLFLSKTETALENLLFLYNENKISKNDSKIIKAFEFLKALKMTGFVSFLFQKTKNKLKQNLLSEKPSLLFFDLYKLGYFCFLH